MHFLSLLSKVLIFIAMTVDNLHKKFASLTEQERMEFMSKAFDTMNEDAPLTLQQKELLDERTRQIAEGKVSTLSGQVFIAALHKKYASEH